MVQAGTEPYRAERGLLAPLKLFIPNKIGERYPMIDFDPIFCPFSAFLFLLFVLQQSFFFFF